LCGVPRKEDHQHPYLWEQFPSTYEKAATHLEVYKPPVSASIPSALHAVNQAEGVSSVFPEDLVFLPGAIPKNRSPFA
jgi:hypothetical protein